MKNTVSLMLSGGLDSYIAYWFGTLAGKEIIPISVNLGHPYHWKEKKAIDGFSFADKVRHIDCEVLRDEYHNQPTIENWIIPGRNLLLGTIGAIYSNEIWLCALSTEFHRVEKNADKTPEFFLMASGLLTFVCGMVKEDGNYRQETLLRSPFKQLSKREIVYWALHNNITPEDLTATASCFSENEKACGQCPTCFNRWVAMSLNGIKEPYHENPIFSNRGQTYLTEMRQAVIDNDFTHYAHKRVYETFSAVRKAGLLLDSITNGFVDKNEQEYEDKLKSVPYEHLTP